MWWRGDDRQVQMLDRADGLLYELRSASSCSPRGIRRCRDQRSDLTQHINSGRDTVEHPSQASYSPGFVVNLKISPAGLSFWQSDYREANILHCTGLLQYRIKPRRQITY